MNLTIVRAGIGMLLMAASFATSPLSASSQTLFSLENGRPRMPDAKQVPKTSFVFKASEFYLAGGTAFDMTTTVQGLGHPTTACKSDGSFLTHYYVVETGWARFLGDRDPTSAVMANVILNAGIDRFSRRLYARGGRWRALAIGTNVLKGTLNAFAAGSNIRSDERINQRVRLATGYRGMIVWSR